MAYRSNWPQSVLSTNVHEQLGTAGISLLRLHVSARLLCLLAARIQRNSCTHTRRVRDGPKKQLTAIQVIYRRPRAARYRQSLSPAIPSVNAFAFWLPPAPIFDPTFPDVLLLNRAQSRVAAPCGYTFSSSAAQSDTGGDAAFAF